MYEYILSFIGYDTVLWQTFRSVCNSIPEKLQWMLNFLKKILGANYATPTHRTKLNTVLPRLIIRYRK